VETVRSSLVDRCWGEGGMNGWSTEDLGGVDITLCDTVMMDICHCTFVQTELQLKEPLQCEL
jgi:hypothetical protein